MLVLVVLMAAGSAWAAGSEVADAAMKRNGGAVRALLQRKANVNAPQVDGTTALHWAVRARRPEMADLLIRAGANVSAANREGVRAAAAGGDERQRADARQADQGRRRSRTRR